MRLFAGGATTPLVVKIWTKQPWVKIEYSRTLIRISRYLEAKFDYRYFIIFFALWFQDSTQKSQVILSKNEGVTAIFPNFDFILNQENQCHGFIFAWNDLKFFV